MDSESDSAADHGDTHKTHFKNLLQNRPIGVCVIDKSQKVTSCNRQFEDYIGVTASQLKAEGWARTIHPEDRARIRAEWERAFAQRIRFRSQCRIRLPDGPTHEILIDATPSADESSQFSGYLSTVVDIPQAQASETDLSENEERLFLALSGSNAGYFDFDLKTGLVYCSPLFNELVGLDPEGGVVTAADLEKQVHPDDAKKHAEAIEAHVRGETPEFLIEYRVLQNDGSYSWIENRGKASFDENGVPIRINGSATDINRRKEAELALAESEERLLLALEGSGAGTFDWDVATSKVHCSPRLLEIIGDEESREDLNSDEVILRIHPDEAGTCRRILRDSFGTGQPVRIEFRFQHADGHYLWLDLRGKPSANTEGSPLRVAGFVMDITEQKRVEIALREAEAQATAASQAKSDFLATMSHEIRTPMNGVIGAINLLCDTGLREEQREYADIVLSSGTVLMNIINDVLDYSKLESGALELEDSAFDPQHVAESVSRLLLPTAGAKDNSLLVDVDDGVPQAVRGDPTRINQVLLNLVSNAVKFTDAGEIHIGLSTDRLPDGQQRLWFAIRDSGIGIAPEAIHRLFKKFSQEDTSTTRRFGGSGLGLAICRQLVELMGGEIEVESTQGEGSCFRFWLPLVVASTNEVRPGNKTSASSYRAVRPLNILVAEDNEINQALIERFLEKLGHRCKIVEDGQAAVDAVKSEDFELILMDIHMPQMGGIEATRRIKRIGGAKAQVPILACTADVIEDHQSEFFEVGMIGSVSKPIDVGDLVEKIDACFPEPIHEATSDASALEAPAPTSGPTKTQGGALDVFLEGLAD